MFKDRKKVEKVLERLLPSAILVITLIAIVISLSKSIVDDSDIGNTLSVNIDKLVSDNYKTVDVHFSNISTSDKEYDMLKSECDNFVKNETSLVQLNTGIELDRQVYADNVDEYNSDNKDNTLHETGPIYLQDKILMRYINEKGEMKIVASMFSNKQKDFDNVLKVNKDIDEYETVTYGINDIYKIFDNTAVRSINDIMLDTNRLYQVNYNQKYNNDKIIPTLGTGEQEYLRDVSDIFLEILRKSSDKIEYKLKRKALQYFTLDGYNNIINNADKINVKNSDMSIVFIEAGKSDSKLQDKDRIVMQIEINTDTDKFYTTIIVKLNDKHKIFDIDII